MKKLSALIAAVFTSVSLGAIAQGMPQPTTPPGKVAPDAAKPAPATKMDTVKSAESKPAADMEKPKKTTKKQVAKAKVKAKAKAEPKADAPKAAEAPKADAPKAADGKK